MKFTPYLGNIKLDLVGEIRLIQKELKARYLIDWPGIDLYESIFRFVIVNGQIFQQNLTKEHGFNFAKLDSDRLRYLGEWGYLMHNHPEGPLSPSDADLKLVALYPNYIHGIIMPDYHICLYDLQNVVTFQYGAI